MSFVECPATTTTTMTKATGAVEEIKIMLPQIDTRPFGNFRKTGPKEKPEVHSDLAGKFPGGRQPER